MNRAMIAAAALLTLAPGVAAQSCRGVPSQRLHLMASRLELNDGTPSYTGELGLHAGMNGLNLNYNTSNVGNPGSVTRSMGLRLYRQREWELFSLCALIGYQLGYAYLKDVEGSVMNYRETATTVPVALPMSVHRRFGPAELVAWWSPQYLYQRSVGQLYDRGDTLKIDESPSAMATELGITARFTIGFVRIARFKRSDRDADVTLGAGIAW